jgi:hypothetical protein
VLGYIIVVRHFVFMAVFLNIMICDLYYKHITIMTDNFSVDNKFETSLTDDVRVIIYDRHMFIVQAIFLNIYKRMINFKCIIIF